MSHLDAGAPWPVPSLPWPLAHNRQTGYSTYGNNLQNIPISTGSQQIKGFRVSPLVNTEYVRVLSLKVMGHTGGIYVAIAPVSKCTQLSLHGPRGRGVVGP